MLPPGFGPTDINDKGKEIVYNDDQLDEFKAFLMKCTRFVVNGDARGLFDATSATMIPIEFAMKIAKQAWRSDVSNDRVGTLSLIHI